MSDPRDFSDLDPWLEFAGALHPVVLHLPIGLLAAAVLLELGPFGWGLIGGPRRALNGLLALSAVVAAASGWLLGRGDDYAAELVDEHRWQGIAVAGLCVAVALLDRVGRGPRARGARRAALLAACVAMLVAGHHGGMLTHGRQHLASAPPPLDRWLGASSDARGSADRRVPAIDPPASAAVGGPTTRAGLESVLAALESRCYECHGESKRKAGLRLDTDEGLASVLVAGDPAASTILERLRLPRGDEEAMPPSGPALAEDTIAALEAWIARGAASEELRSARAGAIALRDERARRRESEARLATTVAELTGARLEALDSSETGGLLSVDFRHGAPRLEPAGAAALAPLAGRVVELRLAGLELPTDALDALPVLPLLEVLRVERTDLDDARLALLLERAPKLELLNLHSSRVTSASVDALARSTGLIRLVAYDTPLANEGLAHLEALRPELRVDRTGGLPAAPLAARPPRRILAADASVGRVALLREIAIGRPELLWQRSIEALHDLQWLGDTSDGHGRVLIQDSWTRVLEIDTASDRVLWSYDALEHGPGPVEIHSFRRLEDGTTMIAESGRGRLLLVDAAGEVLHRIPLELSAPHPHHDTRLVRPTPAGTFLVAHERDGVVREYDRDGAVIWSYDVPLFDRERAAGHGHEAHGDQVFCALRLADGDTLVATGNGSSLLRVRPNGSLRWHLGQEDLGGVRLAWTTTVQVLSSGNLVLGNCHAGPEQPQLVEITPEGELVWSFSDHALFGDSLSNAEVVEAAP